MTRQQIFGLCLAASFLLHMWGMQQDWNTDTPPGSDEIIIPVDFDIATMHTANEALTLEQAAVPGADERNAENAARRLRKQMLRQYFQQVRAAIEQRKFHTAGDLSGLLGNVLYSFHIRPDDTFTNIRLRRSSGDPLLDSAAKNAILTTSGKVKRPKIIQGQSFNLSIAVKYQLSM